MITPKELLLALLTFSEFKCRNLKTKGESSLHLATPAIKDNN